MREVLGRGVEVLVRGAKVNRRLSENDRAGNACDRQIAPLPSRNPSRQRSKAESCPNTDQKVRLLPEPGLDLKIKRLSNWQIGERVEDYQVQAKRYHHNRHQAFIYFAI